MKKVLIAILSFLFLANSANATVISINFEDATPSTLLDNFYSSLGVTFVDALVTLQGGLAGGSGSNTIVNVNGAAHDASEPLQAIFSNAVSSVSIKGLDVGVNGFALVAFDSDGVQVDAQQVVGTSTGFNEFYTLTVNAANIHRVEFYQAFDILAEGIIFDDFSFTLATVNAPSTLLFFGVLIFIIGFHRHKSCV